MLVAKRKSLAKVLLWPFLWRMLEFSNFNSVFERLHTKMFLASMSQPAKANFRQISEKLLNYFFFHFHMNLIDINVINRLLIGVSFTDYPSTATKNGASWPTATTKLEWVEWIIPDWVIFCKVPLAFMGWVGCNPFWWTVGELNLQSRQAGWANEYSIGASQAQLVLGRLFGVGQAISTLLIYLGVYDRPR